MAPDRLSAITRKFQDQSIKANPEWLEGCISWFVAEDPTITVDNLYKRTYDQWLLGDVAEVSLPCLPDSLFGERSDPFDLTGDYVLQLNFVLEISESPYDQLRVLHNRVLDATDEEKIEQRQRIKKNRMIKLDLTDGCRSITAMEHQPIAKLSTKLVPGCKILLRGPMKVINRVLFLTPPNIQLLGGELDSLLIKNAYENVLLRKLNQPEKTDPIRDYIEPTVAESINATNQSLIISQRHNNSRPANFSRPTEDDYKFTNKIPTRPVDPFDDDPMDDDFLMAAAVAKVEEIESRSTSQATTSLNNIHINNMSSGISSSTSTAPPPVTSQQQILSNFHDFIDTSLLLADDDPFDVAAIQLAMDVENDKNKNSEIFSAGYEFQYESCHLTTIEQIQGQQIETFANNKQMIVKARFEAVVEKLKFTGESETNATMSIIVQDAWSRGKLRVLISSAVMDTLLLYDTKELKEMFKNIQRQPQVRDEIQVALEDLKQKVQNLNGFIRLNYTTTDGFVLLEIMKPNAALNAKFAGKIKKERLIVVKQ